MGDIWLTLDWSLMGWGVKLPHRRVCVHGVFRTKSIMALHRNPNLYIVRKETEWEVRIWGQSERIYSGTSTWMWMYLSIVYGFCLYLQEDLEDKGNHLPPQITH